jgi:hypothetical protein
MSDLSRLLDDLYHDDTPTRPPSQSSWIDTVEAVETTETDEPFVEQDEPVDDLFRDTPDRAPAWSSDEALDEAFASWVPGPSQDDTAAQRSIVENATFEEVFEPVITLEDMALTAPVAVDRPRWTPADDDILPSRRGRRRR